MKHLPALDGLRAVAVLAVVAYHAGLPVPAGFVGVDVFFVISGYLITRLLADEVRATGRIDFMHFYARRARRILPAAVLVVGVTLALSLLLPSGRAEVAESAAAASVFGANFYFQAVTGGYWDASAESMPLLHLWSLSVEEQFYLLWPLLLLLAAKRFQGGVQIGVNVRDGRAGGWLKPIFTRSKLRNRNAIELAEKQIVGMQSGALAQVENDVRKLHGVHGLTIPLFFVAVASFLLAEALMYSHPQAAFYQMPARAWELAAGGIVAVGSFRVPRWSATAGLLVTLAACFVPLPHFPGIGALPAVAGATLLIAGIHAGQSVRALTMRPVVYVGLISYSLYLWHWPLLAIDRASRVGDAPLSVRLALCAAAFVLAAMSYRYVEQPFRRSRASPRKAVAVGLACVAALSCTAFAMSGTAEPAPKVVIPLATWKQCHPYGPGVRALVQAPHCVPGVKSVAIWGDSYAGTWAPIAQGIAERKGLPAITFTESTCYAATGITLTLANPKNTAFCRKHNEGALAYLQANPADTVIVTSYWMMAFRDVPDDAAVGLRNLVRSLSPHTERILIIGPTPIIRDTPSRCIELGQSCDVSREDFEAKAKPIRVLMAELDAMPKVEIIDPTAKLCDATNCPAILNGTPAYNDNNHVSEPVAVAFAKDWITRQ